MTSSQTMFRYRNLVPSQAFNHFTYLTLSQSSAHLRYKKAYRSAAVRFVPLGVLAESVWVEFPSLIQAIPGPWHVNEKWARPETWNREGDKTSRHRGNNVSWYPVSIEAIKSSMWNFWSDLRNDRLARKLIRIRRDLVCDSIRSIASDDSMGWVPGKIHL